MAVPYLWYVLTQLHIVQFIDNPVRPVRHVSSIVPYELGHHIRFFRKVWQLKGASKFPIGKL